MGQDHAQPRPDLSGKNERTRRGLGSGGYRRCGLRRPREGENLRRDDDDARLLPANPRGRWCLSGNHAIVYYVDGKQKWETIGPSRREAERALTARKREVDTGTWREPSSETLASYAERWLAHRDPARIDGGGRTRLSPSTFEGYRLNLRRHVLPRVGDRTLSSLRTEDVDRLIAELEADGKAPGTVRNVVVPLRKLLADAVRQGPHHHQPGG